MATIRPFLRRAGCKLREREGVGRSGERRHRGLAARVGRGRQQSRQRSRQGIERRDDGGQRWLADDRRKKRNYTASRVSDRAAIKGATNRHICAALGGGGRARLSMLSSLDSGFHASILVVKAHDVVFPDVISALNLDHHQRFRAGIFQPVLCFQRDESRFVDVQADRRDRRW